MASSGHVTAETSTQNEGRRRASRNSLPSTSPPPTIQPRTTTPPPPFPFAATHAIMTAEAASPSIGDGHEHPEQDNSASKPLARSRSPTPDEEPSRKRRRPDSPSVEEVKASNSDTDKPAQSHATGEPDEKEDGGESPKAEAHLKEAAAPTNGVSTSDDDDEDDEREEGELPPLPPGPPPEEPPSDGWEAIWEAAVGQYYFYNHNTGETTWTNPRVPPAEEGPPPLPAEEPPKKKTYGGYDPAIHGDYDPTAPYAQEPERTPSPTIDPYVTHAAFNRFTGHFQAEAGTERYNDESRARRQMEIFFDVDAAANCHDGRSLKAERQAKKLTKKEVKAFREKTRLKKEEKKRAWLRD
ncbi:hypothetical protein H072_6199 [Dactylellina haptotyla CBS 200.50]|uniref:WW domain-containing protein n=1 Tax=Dactylellina haptotyla (strain CBS 200.50) TaxID=1284197 RepID=S8AA66_DACHA|nr:hypothetical protein H072_6199 [Dactylellina haptotyla CBS 200.50]